eukprot:3665342-Pleurochrysis_carterae.AAC.2
MGGSLMPPTGTLVMRRLAERAAKAFGRAGGAAGQRCGSTEDLSCIMATSAAVSTANDDAGRPHRTSSSSCSKPGVHRTLRHYGTNEKAREWNKANVLGVSIGGC